MKKIWPALLPLLSMNLFAAEIDYADCLKQVGIESKGATITSKSEIEVSPKYIVMGLFTKEKTTKTIRNGVETVKKVTSRDYMINDEKTMRESLQMRVEQDMDSKVLKISTGDNTVTETVLTQKRAELAQDSLNKLLNGEETLFPKLKNKGANPSQSENWSTSKLELSEADREAILKFRNEQEGKNRKKVHPKEVALIKAWTQEIKKMSLELKLGVEAEFEYANNRCYLTKKVGRFYHDGNIEMVDEVTKSDCERAVLNFATCQRGKELCDKLVVDLNEVKKQAEMLKTEGLNGKVREVSSAGLGGETEKFKQVFELSYLCKESFNLPEVNQSSKKSNTDTKALKQ